MRRRLNYGFAALSAAAIALATTGSALAQKKYDSGASDTEIKIGNIMPYSGPASAYGVIGKTEAAYFKMINDKGGVNGRKINFITYDDGYSPPKAVEQARKLVDMFIANFGKFEDQVDGSVRDAAPGLKVAAE